MVKRILIFSLLSLFLLILASGCATMDEGGSIGRDTPRQGGHRH